MKKLDFNALEQPVLELTLKDEAKTVVRCAVPEEELVERLGVIAADLPAVVKDTTGQTTRQLFAFCAELMSCNADGLTFTAEELRDKYKLKLYDLVVFVKMYLEFIKEIEGAKN